MKIKAICFKRSIGFFSLIFIVLLLLGLIPADKAPYESEFIMDTDGNGRTESYQLTHGTIQVIESEQLVWQSPAAWQVQQICLSDADNDGQAELLIVLWKEGSFGKAKPLWSQEDDGSRRCHLFVYRLVAGKMKPVWCSSALDRPIWYLEEKDNDNTGKTEFVVHEDASPGAFSALRRFLPHHTGTWVWENWGFVQDIQNTCTIRHYRTAISSSRQK